MTQPTVDVLDVLESNWRVSDTPLANPPEFNSGRYERHAPHPSISVHSKNEGPWSGGETGYTALNPGSGLGMQVMSGYLLVDCVAGTEEDCEGVGTNGGFVHPKEVRQKLYIHVCDLLQENQTYGGYRWLSPGSSQEMQESIGDDESTRLYITEVRAKFGYDRG